MAELELVKLHEDGEHLVLRAPDGEECTLPISDALRAAVRRDRPRTETTTPAPAPESTLRPRELQARLRGGASAEELAVEAGIPVDHVQRYEWPVVAERAHVIGQVRAHRLDAGDTTLGEVADARLAARGVMAKDAAWTARRDGTAPWVVEVRFSAGDRDRGARWTYDARTRVVTPLDDEARWLSQPDDPLSPEVFGVPSLVGRSGRPNGGSRRSDAMTDATSLLLDDLADRRGQRPNGRAPRRTDDAFPDALPLDELELPQNARGAGPGTSGPADDAPGPGTADHAGTVRPDEGPDGPDGPDDDRADDAADDRADDRADDTLVPAASVVDLGSRRPRTAPRPGRPETGHPAGRGAARPPVAEPSPPAGAPPAPASPAPTTPAPTAPVRGTGARRPARKGRAQVPSWDEIVFGGARTDK